MVCRLAKNSRFEKVMKTGKFPIIKFTTLTDYGRRNFLKFSFPFRPEIYAVAVCDSFFLRISPLKG